jgi:hypothetical protein
MAGVVSQGFHWPAEVTREIRRKGAARFEHVTKLGLRASGCSRHRLCFGHASRARLSRPAPAGLRRPGRRRGSRNHEERHTRRPGPRRRDHTKSPRTARRNAFILASTVLRALLLFDEVYAFLPPHPQNPPTKRRWSRRCIPHTMAGSSFGPAEWLRRGSTSECRGPRSP